MPYHRELDHRHSIRLSRYDYSQNGAYFVTLCTHNKRRLFGEVVDGDIRLSSAGLEARRCWLEIPVHFPDVELDLFVVMPNHVHGIVVIGGATDGADDYSPLPGTSRTIGSIVRGFKIGVTKWFREHDPQVLSVWQRNYYEHVIRNEAELDIARQYIINNPIRRGE